MPRPSPTLPACLVLVVAMALPWRASAQAAPQSLQAIRDAAIAGLQAAPGSQAMVAPGLRLAACSQALVAEPSGAATVQVRCPDTPGWRLFVPVRRKPVAKALPSVAPPANTGTASAAAPALFPETASPAVTLKRGDPVVLRATIGGTEVRMGGRALGPAVAGATVNVENDSSHRIVRGRLAPDGTVEVAN